MSRDLADFLADGGAVVGGGAAMCAVLGFVAGSIAHDSSPDVDPDAWGGYAGMVGGVIGLGALIERWTSTPDMSKRARNLVAIAVAALAGFGCSRLSADWNWLEFYAGMAVLIAVVGVPLTAFVLLPNDPYPRLRRSRG